MRAAGCMKPRPKSQMTTTNVVLDARTATLPEQPQAPPQPPSVFPSTEQRAAETEGSLEIGPCGESGLAFGGSDAIDHLTASRLPESVLAVLNIVAFTGEGANDALT